MTNTLTRAEAAQKKLQILEMLAHDPQATDAELARVSGLSYKTTQKYHKEILVIINQIKEQVEQKEKQITQESVGIWEQIKRMMNPG